jgi:aminoglycoside/choline kinase family phosphotransferase
MKLVHRDGSARYQVSIPRFSTLTVVNLDGEAEVLTAFPNTTQQLQ